MRSKLCMFLVLLSSILYGQIDNVVNDYIRDKKYGKSPTLDLYIIDNGFKIPEKILESVFTTIEYGAKNAYYYGKINKREIKNNLEVGFAPYKCHYLGFYEILNFKFDKKNKVHNLEWVADFKIIDVFTGEIIMITNFIYHYDIKGYHEYVELGEIKDFNQFFENNRLGVTNMINSKYPRIGMLSEITEQKKDKAKEVAMALEQYIKCGKPKEMYVFAEGDKVAKKEKELMTFKYIGKLKVIDPKTPNKSTFFEVKDGDKEILQYFNNNIPLYVSSIKFGE